MKGLIVGLLICLVAFAGGYFFGMRHYSIAEKDAAIEALAISVSAGVKSKASYKRANSYLVDQLTTFKKAWGIYEKDNVDRCARTVINDPRLAWLLLDMSEGNQAYSHPAPDAVFAESQRTSTEKIIWGDVGSYAVEAITGLRACNAKIDGLAIWFDEIGAVPLLPE